MNESKIIESLYEKGKIQIDDCYLNDSQTIITTDSMCENTHFKLEWSSPSQIAQKLIESNISDIASSGGIPTKVFFNLGLNPKKINQKWIKKFSVAFKKKVNHYSIELCGGDTFYSEIIFLNLTMIGKLIQKPILRKNAENLDFLYITGEIGFSHLGFQILNQKLKTKIPKQIQKKAIEKHLAPNSRVGVMRELLEKYEIHSCIDLSDGLTQDSQKLAFASKLGIEIPIEKIPGIHLSSYLSIDEILSSGEEYELLFTSKNEIEKIIQEIPVTKIGMITDQKNQVSFYKNSILYKPKIKGYTHF